MIPHPPRSGTVHFPDREQVCFWKEEDAEEVKADKAIDYIYSPEELLFPDKALMTL